MSRKCVISALVAPFLACIVLMPLVLATAEQKVASEINEHTLKAAAELKNHDRLKRWPLPLSHALLHPRKEGE